MLNQSQVEHLSTIRFINKIDSQLKIITAVNIFQNHNDSINRVTLFTELYYDGERVSELSFDVHNFSYEEIVALARNVRKNDFIMHEIDTFLAGDIE